MRRVLTILALFLLAGVAVGQTTAPVTQPAPPALLPKTQHWLGVAVENIPPAMARQLKLKKDQGLLVVSVLPNTPAQAAGLQPDDLLISANGQPLRTQEELAARVANRFVSVEGRIAPQASKLLYLRDGERREVELTPAPRPAGAIVYNPSAAFVPNAADNPGARGVRSYALPDGATVQVAPGYRFNLNSPDATSKSIRSIVSKGQTVILSQETDAAGTVTNTIGLGSTSYLVTREKLAEIPADLRPLAEQLLKPPAQPVAAPRRGTEQLEDRIQELEKSNQQLRQRVEQLLDAMGKNKTEPRP